MATSIRKSNQLEVGTLADNTPVVIGDPATGDFLRTTLLDLFGFFKIRQTVPNTASIPFTHLVTEIAPHTMSGARNISPLFTGAKSGYGAFQRITGDGTNTPVFSGFKKTNASKDFLATAGAVNVVIFFFDGTNYWYTIYQEAGTGTPAPVTPAAPTAAVVDDGADTFNWTATPGYPNVSDYEQTLDGGNTWTPLSAKPIAVGNIAKAIGQVGVRVKAAGINNPSAGLFNASAFNVAAPTTDADAQAYFTARAAITDGALSSGDQTKWDTFVKGLKSNGLWSDILQLCYLNGTVRQAVGINAKTPGTRDVTFVTAPGFTPPDFLFDSQGVLPNAGAATGHTGIFPATDLENNNLYVAFFSRDNNNGGEHYFFGAQESGVGVLKLQNAVTQIYASAGSNNGENAAASKNGFLALHRGGASSLKVYRNEVEVLDSTAANTGTLPNSELLIFKISLDRTPTAIAGDPNVGIYNATGVNKCGFWIVTKNMTPTKHAALNTLVQNLMA